MSIPPPNDPSRGCSSKFSQPLGEEDFDRARNLMDNINRVNILEGNLTEITYRTADENYDIRAPVHRWDTRPYQEIFANGFQAWSQGQTPNSTYYNLLNFIEHAGAPLDPTRPSTSRHVFVSTTLNNAWRPSPSTQVLPEGSEIQFYRYEIYAPGGIWVGMTLWNRYTYVSQDEVCYVGGIAPQYIRSCLIFTATREAGSRYPRITRETRLIINRNFNPMSHPYVALTIYIPVYYYTDDNGVRRDLPEETYPPRREKREALDADEDVALEWYTSSVLEIPSYIDSAFRSARAYEVYFFLKNKYVRLYYTPGKTDDKILTDLRWICDGFPSLEDTPFGEYGIDCAFDTEGNEAYIFCTKLCAYIDYAPGTMNDKILSGPTTIAEMFPVLKNTVFENGIDSAFRSTRGKEVYLFKGNKYGRIAYDSKQLIGTIRNITDGFPILKGTIFENGIDACFASHKENQAYLYKGENYVRINFTPGTTGDTLVDVVKPILNGWPCLRGILPLDNKGVDSHPHTHHQPSYPEQHDEL